LDGILALRKADNSIQNIIIIIIIISPQTSIPLVGFEPKVPTFEQVKLQEKNSMV
jgi:hypothetical protein